MNNVFSTFYKEANPIKCFIDGGSQKTLKKLDVSSSLVRFKTIRPLFQMNELEEIILDNCEKLGNEFDTISSKIFSVSLENLPITVENLGIILYKTKILMTLNVKGTSIKKH